VGNASEASNVVSVNRGAFRVTGHNPCLAFSLAVARIRPSRGIIRFAHPSGRTELRALLRCATFLQRLCRQHGACCLL